MLEKIKKLNEQLIEKYKNDLQQLEKQLLIKRILSEKNCFFKMNIETAYSILKDLEVKEDCLKEIYCELIDYKNIE